MLLSMASLVIFMQLRVLYDQLCSRLRRHGNYRKMLRLVQSSCPLENLHFEEESEWEENKCAICWEAAAVARRLPCGHHFHHGIVPIVRPLVNHLHFPVCSRRLFTALARAGSHVSYVPTSTAAGWFRRSSRYPLTIKREYKSDIVDGLEPIVAALR